MIDTQQITVKLKVTLQRFVGLVAALIYGS
jgi:hypothetical protein